MQAIVPIILTGSNVTRESAEELAKGIEFAMKLAKPPDDTEVKIGEIVVTDEFLNHPQ